MNLRISAVLICLALLASFASAQYYGKQMASPGQTRAATNAPGGIRIDQKLGSQVPPDIALTNQDGKEVNVASLLGERPLVLLLGFYRCKGVCTDEISNAVRAFKGFRKDNVGEVFDFAFVSIDPTETPVIAKAQWQLWLDTYDRPGAEEGWNFLVGSQGQVGRLADAVGFRYEYDPKSGNIVHPAGLIVLTPSGRVSRYMLGTEYSQRVLLNSIKDAAALKVGVRDSRPFFMACVNIDPLTGQRTLNVLNTVKTFGVLTVLFLVASIVVMSVQNKRRSKEPSAGGGAPA